MSSGSSWRTILVPGIVAVVALVGACGSEEGPVGRPGGRDGVRLLWSSPRVQVVPTGSRERVIVALEARREGDDGTTEPWPGATFEVRVVEGAARPVRAFVTTSGRGVASVAVETPGAPDRTRLEFVLAGDGRQHLPFDVVTAPAIEAGGTRGEIQEVALSPVAGSLVRFELDRASEYLLMPYQIGDRGPAPYRLHYRAPGDVPGPTARGGQPADVPRSRPAVVVEDRGHIVVGALAPGGLEASASIPPTVNVRSCRIDVDRPAFLRYLGRHVALYVDGPPDLHQTRIDSLGRAFDEDIFPLNTRLFGATTDFDRNGVVVVVMSPALEGLGGVYCDTVRTIGVEAFYARWNPTDPIGAPLGTLAHEHQHVVNAGHHRQSRGAVGDERWLNEALSYAAEAIHGYWIGPLARMWSFLGGQNGGFAMLPFEYARIHDDEYMMFALYLRDRFGPDTWLRLGLSGKAGRANVEAVTGMPLDDLVREWFLAAGLGGRDLALDPRFAWSSVDLGGMEEEIATCQCVPPARFEGMTLESLPLQFSFDFDRTLQEFDADYFRLALPAGMPEGSYTVWFDNAARPTVRFAIARLR